MTSITSNLPGFVSEPLINLIGKVSVTRPTASSHRTPLTVSPQKCYASLVENLDLSDSKCLKLSISKVLGFGIVVGGSIVKIPQVLLSTRIRISERTPRLKYILVSCPFWLGSGSKPICLHP